MSFTILYNGKRKTVNNIERAIEIAKELPPGKVVINDADKPTRQVWERSE